MENEPNRDYLKELITTERSIFQIISTALAIIGSGLCGILLRGVFDEFSVGLLVMGTIAFLVLSVAAASKLEKIYKLHNLHKNSRS